MKLLYVGNSACSADTLARLFLLGSELCFLDRPSVTFGTWGTVGHESQLRRFSSEGLPVKVSIFKPPSGPANEFYLPYIEADLQNPEFIKIVLDGLASDQAFAEKLIQPEANYGSGITGEDLQRHLVQDRSLYEVRYDLNEKPSPQGMFRPDTSEGRKLIAKTLLVDTSIEVTSALIMGGEVDALPVADDPTYPRLLALRATDSKYVGNDHLLAPLLGLQFARAVIPDEALKKLDFKNIFEYRDKSKDAYEAWSTVVSAAAAKISDSDFADPGDAIKKIVSTELMPKLKEYENEMTSVRDKLFADLIKGVAAWELPTISAAYFTDLSNFGTLSLFATGLKAAAVVAGAAKGAVAPFTDYVVAKRAAQRSANMVCRTLSASASDNPRVQAAHTHQFKFVVEMGLQMTDRKKTRAIVGYTQKQQIANSAAWYALAKSFYSAADVLQEFQERIPHDSRPFALNAGFSIELILKSILAKKGIPIPDGPDGHNLLSLCTRAKVNLSENQRATLELLTETIVWSGRYPGPKNDGRWDDYQDRILEKHIIQNQTQNVTSVRANPDTFPDWDNCSKIWNHCVAEFQTIP